MAIYNKKNQTFLLGNSKKSLCELLPLRNTIIIIIDCIIILVSYLPKRNIELKYLKKLKYISSIYTGNTLTQTCSQCIMDL